MRKFYWCCLAGGAAACLAVGTAAYIWRNPDSTLGRLAFAGPPPRAASTDAPGTAPGDDVIPPDPVPVEEPSDPPAIPVLPGAAPQPPQTVAVALTPPIIIHDEEDLNAASLSGAKPKTPDAAPVDVEASRPTTSDVVENEQRPSEDPLEQPSSGPPMMPYCSDDAGSAPYMPYCTDDDPAPIMPAAGDDGEAGRERRPSDAWAGSLVFFPAQLSCRWIQPTA